MPDAATIDLSAGLVPRNSKGKTPASPAAAPIDITSGLVANDKAEDTSADDTSKNQDQDPGLWDRLRSKVQSITEPTAKHKGQMPNPAYGALGPVGMVLDPVEQEIGLNFIKRTGRALFGLADFAPQAYSALKDALSSDPKVAADGEDRLLSMHPGAQIADRVKELKEDYKKDPKLAAENVAGDVAAMWLADKVTAHAPEAIKKGLSKSVEAAEKTAKTMSGVHRGAATKLVEKTAADNTAAIKEATDANTKAASEHQDKVQTALHETQGRELEHQVKAKSAEEKAIADHAQAVSEAREHNQRVHQKAEAAHKDIADKVDEHNTRVGAKHETVATRIKEENAAAEHALELRRLKETELDQQTKEYYAKEDEVKAKAKAEENAAWQPWHDKMEGVEIDGGRIAKPLQEIAARSPDLSRMIHQLIPDPADVAPESQYALDRSAIMKSQGMDPEKTSYWDLPAGKRVAIDKIAASSGFEPDPIDFDPQAGRAISIEAIHRAKSILGRYASSGRYEGMVLGEMKQVLKVLDQAETRASLDHGALGDLESAKKATQRYQEAFGRERHMPRTQDEIREKEANPEAYKEREDQERLEAARKHSPDLVDAHEKVKALREEIRGMKTEDQLRKSIKRVPLPPSIGDVRNGYRLKPKPKYDPPSVGDVREGYRLKEEPKPELTPSPLVESPHRAAFPDKPPEVKPDIKQIGPEDIAQVNEEGFKKRIETLRNYGIWVAGGVLFETVKSLSNLHVGAAVADLLGGAAALTLSRVALNKVADLLESPKAREFIARPSAEQLAELEKLPPEQRKVVVDGLQKVRVVAAKKKLRFSPLITAYMTATGENEGKKRSDKGEADR